MDSAATSTSKKRRSFTNDTVQTLAHLPDDQLVAIADFLPKTNRALFAVALTAPSKSFRLNGWKREPNAVSKAIIASAKPSTTYIIPPHVTDCNRGKHIREQQIEEESYGTYWEVLDFVDINYYFANRLSDEDLGAILVCIDAKNVLKKCRLNRCPRLIGIGLEPLCGSTILELIDINPLSCECDDFSAAAIAPILDSIIGTAGHSLRQIHLPTKWREGQARRDSPLREFLERFNQLLLSEGVTCGVKGHSAENEDSTIQICFTCYKSACTSCNQSHRKPIIRSCDCCNMVLCSTCGNYAICSQCNSVYCSICADIEDDVDAGRRCTSTQCSKRPACIGCRMKTLDDQQCLSCLGLVVPKFIEKNKQLLEENDKLRKQLQECCR